ncbi:disease resistance protein RGA2-like [Quercus robur]|uniref:disease resistance protein RGA2-like n=1 Tax=Quercus robur TaxID=38942 RepID=UPI002163EA03|nr:disease resistance protein RGA2-like [Quercus robur]XP_050261559.1 disease resistance protein RGA2-like [Quercus robur]XP_050261560.1 disease resistance protein RGA2-like [Quercus robur]XP_050261561.1 disease resistance protein RGA2-like [Quercus robur]XP_050261562.1 disease resistance protein RGA2-like [Quercus robur]XP_050261563.1 disease resistance protein RGA2-like [Quercus robur]XP_050261564.1 disease resistance protein RGA2-like [Quercus robur]XP_050261565.1 disease resistance prote
MANPILHGAVQSISQWLGSYTIQQIESIWCVKAEFKKMNHTVSTIHAVLDDAEEQQVENHQVKDWLLKLRDAVFDADDLLSEFSTHVLQKRVMDSGKMPKKVRIFFSSSNQLVFRFNMARNIKDMRERLDGIANDRNNFQLKLVDRPLETWVVTRGRDQTHSFVREEEVIGREDDKKAIIDLLLDFDMEENVSFISVVGMGGLGKTTLVQYVYNDEEVTAYFELKMWVCVSDVFDVTAIVEKIIASATNERPKNLEMDQLQNELRKNLNQKKYLLVMDDVWNEDEEIWCTLRTLLLDGSKGSKVLITTRTELVADITSTVSPYFLKGLSENQSWSLFKQMTWGKKQEIVNPNLEAIGRDIVEKCCGVPLAIKTIGRVLYFKKTEAEWLYIKNNELTNVIQLRDCIIPVLKLSYNHLPSHLKCCFAYCSLFPKNYLIDKFTLIQLWIAQGFIQSSEENLQLEEVANEYFMDLHWRSFFQEAVEDQGRNMFFKMHDLIHDLAQSISRIECTLVDSNAKNVNEKVRHLSFPSYHSSFFEENLTLLVKANKIRTFILTSDPYLTRFDQASYKQSVFDDLPILLHFAIIDGRMEESTLKTLILTFKYLRVFDLHGLQMVTVPKFVGKMMHLSYLDLSYNDIEFLPRSITRLVNLQTLKLIHCKELRELPKDIQKLVRLKHLHINGCKNLTHLPCGLGQLTCLQTLSLFVVRKDLVGSSKHYGELDELNKLNELRGKIEIKNLAWVIDATSKSKVANLKEKQHLSELELAWNPNDDVGIEADHDNESLLDGLQPHQSLKILRVEGYRGVRFSSWLSSLTNLVELYVESCKKCQHLPPLCQLPSLEVLHVRNMDGLEYISDQDIIASMGSSGTTFFPSLCVLILEYCPNLKKWWRRDIVDNGDVATTSTSTSSSHQYQQQISLPYFPRLLFLHILDCDKLSCMPLFPHLDRLILRNASWKPSQQTMAMTMNTVEASLLPSSSSSSSSPLSGLHWLNRLTLENIQDIESLPEEWPQNLISLERLDIWRCPRLTSLSRFMQYLTSLKSLTIGRCELVDQFSDDTECHLSTSTCLQNLVFTEISKLESLPAYLQQVTTLQKLEVSACPSFLTLPEWIGNLTSLRKIVIENCPKLTSLPEGMSRLTSLQMLRIFNCPQLEQRCEKRNGEDWYKIAHVPFYSNAPLDMDDLLGNF